jgi:maltose alpha-D-glucosyltransferase/alpha-amylase
LTETHTFLKELQRHVDRSFNNRLLLTETNEWPEDVAACFGAGDGYPMNFHFPLMPRPFMPAYMKNYSRSSIPWATFANC